MKLIRHLYQGFVDFLFPKSSLILHLESLPSEKVFTLLHAHPEKAVPSLADIFSIFPYRDEIVHDFIHEIKYAANDLLVQKIAPILYETCLKLTYASSTDEKVILTFVPITDNRKEKRGFDQGLSILNAIKTYDMSLHGGRDLHFSYERDILKWQRHVTQQSLSSSKEEREINMKASLIAIQPELIKDRRIIVIDDIYTTGATLYEARRALREAVAREIHLLTIAH